MMWRNAMIVRVDAVADADVGGVVAQQHAALQLLGPYDLWQSALSESRDRSFGEGRRIRVLDMGILLHIPDARVRPEAYH